MSEPTQLPSAKRGPFPDGDPNLWFVEAVPFAIEWIRYFKNRSTHPIVGEVLGRMISDLEMGEVAAVDLVRDICLETSRRQEVH